MIDTTQHVPATKRTRRMAREPKPTGEMEVSNSKPSSQVEPKQAKPASKSSLVLQMLQRPEGVTIAQIVTTTNWLPHTTRAALTGLKKKGHQITSEKSVSEERVYRAVPG